jgi:3-mercaptopropionate dioxygenase
MSMDAALDRFITTCRAVIAATPDAADRVTEIAPCMRDLLSSTETFLRPEHYREDPAHCARNAIYICPDGELSLFALVWLPGQWTPVHDHGSWGVAAVVEGLLEERAYMSADDEISSDAGIRLRWVALCC